MTPAFTSNVPTERVASEERGIDVTGVTRRIAYIIIGISTLTRTLMAIDGYYLLDDYAFIGRSGRPDALSLSTLLEPHLGHLMPAAHVVVWVQQLLAPWNYALPALTMAVGWLVCLLLMYKILNSWLGTRPVLLIPLAVYAVTPLTIQATTWWAAALNAIPLQICALGGTLLLLPLAKGSPRLTAMRQIGVVVLTLIALAFFTKGVLLLVLFAGVAFAWSRGSTTKAVTRAFQSGPSMWVALVGITTAYSLWYGATVPTPSPPSGVTGILAIVDRIGQSVSAGLLPSAAGGPVHFSGGADPLSAPQLWIIGLGVAVVVALIVLVARSTVMTRRLAGVCIAYAIGCTALIAVRQQGFTLEMAASLRYFADLAVPATLLVASLSRDTLGSAPTRHTATGWIGAGLLVIVFSTVSVLTTAQLMGNPYSAAIRDTAIAAQESLAEEVESPVLDMWIPPLLLTPLYYGDYARSSVLFSQTSSGIEFAEQGRALRLWSEQGRLVPARIEGPVARGRPAFDTCDAPPGSPTSLQLSAPVVPFTHAVELTTASTGTTAAQVVIGGGPPRRWILPEGRATMYAWMLAGGTTDVTVVPDDPTVAVCVISVRVGKPVPLEADR
jgi:hypothetical protein